jgi:hypothetical protein
MPQQTGCIGDRAPLHLQQICSSISRKVESPEPAVRERQIVCEWPFLERFLLLLPFLQEITSDGPLLYRRNPPPSSAAQRTK